MKEVDWDGSVSIATCYELDSSGIESQWRIDFPHPSRLDMGSNQPPVQWVLASFPGVKRLGSGFDYPLTSNSEVKERLQCTCSAPPGLHGFL